MGLMSRVMWPKVGERIEVYSNGKLTAKGLVTFMNESTVTVQGENMRITNLRTSDLREGLESHQLTIKKL